MGVADFIDSIQKFLLFFVPGFISLRIKKVYGFQKTHEKFTLSVYALFYSFIIQIFYLVLLYFARQFFPFFLAILSPEIKYIIKVLVYLVLGTVFGGFLAKFSRTDIKRWLEKAINSKYSPEKSIWEAALSTKYRAAHVTVFLKNGLIYKGSLGEHTTDPDDTEKELIIYDYTVCTYDEKTDTLVERANKVNSSAGIHDKEKAYINAREISSIEICPKAKKVNPVQNQLARKKCLKRIKILLLSPLFLKILCCLGSLLIAFSCILPYFTIYTGRCLIEERYGPILIFIALVALIFSICEKYILTMIMSISSFVFFIIECNQIALFKSITMINSFFKKSPLHYGIGNFTLFIGCGILFLFSVMGMYRKSVFFSRVHSENKEDSTPPTRTENTGEVPAASEPQDTTNEGPAAPTQTENTGEAPAASEPQDTTNEGPAAPTQTENTGEAPADSE